MSEDGTALEIYLAGSDHNSQKQQDARDAVEDRFGARSDATLTILEGKYTITQLHSWLTTMTDDISGHTATVTYGIAEDKNRLYVMIDDLSKQSEVEHRVWPWIARRLQFRHLPVSLALWRCSWA